MEPPECETCRAGVKIMFDHLSGDAVDKIIQLLSSEVCSQAEDEAGCILGVETWWPTLASILYNDETTKYVCEGLSGGMCEVFKLK